MNVIKFSIVVPFYNAECFLEETILSILNCNYKKIEIILIDDGSSDSSYDICLSFREKYANTEFILLKQCNSGPNVARNLGIDHATGDFVLFIDADDLLDSKCFETLLPYVHDYKYDYICYGIDFFDNGNNRTLSKKTPKLIEYDNPRVIKEAFGNNELLGVCWNKCISLRFLNLRNIRFEPDKMHGRDILFSRSCAVISNRVLSINNVLCHSRYHVASFSRSFGKANIISAIDLAEKHFDLFEKYVDRIVIESSISKHFNYILLLSSFRSLSYQDFRINHEMIKTAKGDLRISNCESNIKQKLLTAYLKFPSAAWIISKTLNALGYKPY
ncbi:glycosyltransferase family 2 protein [Vibrio kanaloae]|uniref:glycosyltransferase family 2 protein n=1 Tax=Vibrio kanaloae TaxID=170673 RepID=UPI003551651D